MFYWVVKALLAPILRMFRPWAEGTEYVPRTGPAILASNHLSFSDHFFAPLPLPRKVVFLAKSEYFTGRGIKGLFNRAFFSGMGQIPVDRTGGEASERALATGLRVLAGGQLLGIYPEGTRTPDGRLFRGKTGVARLALEARVPVIPCAMIGGFEFQPPGKITPQFKIRPGVKFGKPLDFSRYYGLENDGMVLRAVTDEIIYEIMKLSGQEYVDVYAAQHKTKKHAEKRAHKHDAAAKGVTGADKAAKSTGKAAKSPDKVGTGGAATSTGASSVEAADVLTAGAQSSEAQSSDAQTTTAQSLGEDVPVSAGGASSADVRATGPGSANGTVVTGADDSAAAGAGEAPGATSADAALAKADADHVGASVDETSSAAKAGEPTTG